MIFLQYYGYSGGVFGDFLTRLGELGFFSYVLPFLLIFALVYGILVKSNLFKGTPAVNGIIALAVGLLAMQFDFVPLFFSQIFPRLGVALAAILIILIILSLFMPKENWVIYSLFGVGAITVIIILAQSFEILGWGATGNLAFWWQNNWPLVIGIAFIVIIIAIIVNAGKPEKKFGEITSPLAEAIHNLTGK